MSNRTSPWLFTVIIAASGFLSHQATAEDGPEKPVLQVFSVAEKDFVYSVAGSLLNDPAHEMNNNMYNAVLMSHPGVRAGIGRMIKSEGNRAKDWTYHYHQVIYVLRGRALITAAMPPWKEAEKHEVGVGDFFYLIPSMKLNMDPLSDEPFEFFFVNPTPPLENPMRAGYAE